MLTDRDVAQAVESLAAIPYFPREAGARAAIGRALEQSITDPLTLERLTDRAVRQMREWQGVPAMIDTDEEGDAFYQRIAASEKQLLIAAPRQKPEPIEPVSAEERAEIDRLAALVKARARETRMPPVTRTDREVSRRFLDEGRY